ncbi:MAG: ATP-grasp domain-containing protein [Armatimonadetes bacterium]|nr:ATP-grasp domain-containing protein [Armatimonadota bacterium]
MIRKLLIANRGEIAVRIMRTARTMGVRTVAVFSDADAESLHAKLADEREGLGAPDPVESYLNIEKIVGAAKATGADAIHPGYGFLAENADFADACAEAGLTFVGPTGAAMRKLGAKIEAKQLAVSAGVPVVPGFFEKGAPAERLKAEAKKIGFPVMLKASAGGGGRGMRVVRDESSFFSHLETASSEALNAFGDGAMMVEKLIERPRHVEVQILADHHGRVAALYERECSIQRRHQKLIEEAPWGGDARWAMRDGRQEATSPLRGEVGERSEPGEGAMEGDARWAMGDGDRQSTSPLVGEVRLHPEGEGSERSEPGEGVAWPDLREAAVRLAQAAGYTNAGTVEFIVDDATGRFYFLEVNARLQVEHPVTELITGLDLVAWQLKIASGEALDLPSPLMNGERTGICGHAIEARIVAEDPANGWLPSIGRIVGWAEPKGPGIRVDTGFGAGLEVSRYYDSLLAKVILHGANREEALLRMESALMDFHILGVRTNIEFLLAVLRHPDFRAGQFDTGFLGREFEGWAPSDSFPNALAALCSAPPTGSTTGKPAAAIPSVWQSADTFRNV